VSRPARPTSELTKRRAISAAAILCFVVGWAILSYIAPSYAVPHWSRIIGSLMHIPIQDVLITLFRLVVSMLLSFVIGLTCAVIMFERPYVEAFFIPLVKLMMAVPAVCWVVFAILWFKGVEPRIYFVMLITCVPIFIIDGLDAMKGIPTDLKQMSRSFRPTNLQVLRTVIIPGILPNILTSWKINLTLAVRVVTIAELVGAVNGIGHGLVLAQEMFSISDVFAWTTVLVLILYALQGLVNFAEHHLLRWRTVES
jgi:ABC-type nitrate/sulfonate/bicarbonate transport system permease component